MIERIARQGTLLTVAVLILCLFGILAVLRVPVQMIPDLEVRTIAVRTAWPGATPQDVETEIVIEQEEYLRNVPNVLRMISVAETGQANIELEFPFGVDINEALIRVNNALSQVPAYPENVDEPRLFTSSFSENAFMYFRVHPLPGNSRGLDMNLMRDFIDDNVRTRMERIPGVSQVDVRGGAERQVQIFVDPARLAERGITWTELRDAIRLRNRDVSGGDLDSGKRRYLLRTVGRFETLDDVRDLIVRRDGDALVRLRDVATVRLSHYEIRAQSWVNGQPVINLAVRRETGANVISIKEAMLPAVERLNRDLLEPSGMRMSLIADDVRYVEESIGNIWTNLAIGAFLAASVMFLFLRSVPATLVGLAGIPVCTIAAFLGLLVAGRTINVISLAGVAFAIGMTLDNTIVVLESIERERRRGLGPFDAAIAGVHRVWTAVIASTLTTVLVFAPVLFVQEEAGQLYSDVAVAVSASILASMAVALIVVPAACARLRFRERTDDALGGHGAKDRLLRGISWIIDTPRRRWTCLLSVVGSTILAIVLLTPPAEYLPEGEEPKLFARMIAPPGYSLTEMKATAKEIEAQFLPSVVDLEDAGRTVADPAIPPLAYFNMIVQPQFLVVISEPEDPARIDELMAVMTDRFSGHPGMRAFAARGSIISSNDGGTRSVNVDVSGPDLAAIYDVAERVYRRARDVVPGVQVNSDPPSLTLGQPLVEIRPRWDRAAELGLSATDLGYAFSALTDGAYVDEFLLEDDKIDVFLYGAPDAVSSLDRIGDLPVYSPGQSVVPIRAIADVVETVGSSSTRRLNGERTITLNVIAPRSIPLETAVGIVERDVVGHLRETGQIPAGVTADLSGASDQLDATREALSGNFVVALVLSYLLLVVIFTHWGYPLLIMLNVPLGIAGGIVGLWLLNAVGGLLPWIGLAPVRQPFDMITMLGFLILLGTVVNNPILMVDLALQNVREGMPLGRAVRDAVDARLRPILMTTITTVCGLSPLVFLPGAGTELYRGLGAIVLFGLLFSTAVTLVFLPALLVTVLERRAPGMGHEEIAHPEAPASSAG